MSWLDKWDKHNQSVSESSGRLYKIVTAPDGGRYEVEAMNASTATAGAPPWLDLVLLGRALLRRVRGIEWEVVVRRAAGSRQPVFGRNVSTQTQAKSMVAELATILASKGVGAINDR